MDGRFPQKDANDASDGPLVDGRSVNPSPASTGLIQGITAKDRRRLAIEQGGLGGQASWGQVDAAGLQVFQILRRSTAGDKATPLIGPSITVPAATTLTFCPFCNKRRTWTPENRT